MNKLCDRYKKFMSAKMEKIEGRQRKGDLSRPGCLALVCGMARILMVGIGCGIKAWGLPHNRSNINKSSKAESGIVWSKNRVYLDVAVML